MGRLTLAAFLCALLPFEAAGQVIFDSVAVACADLSTSSPLCVAGLPTRSSGEAVVFVNGSGDIVKGALADADIPNDLTLGTVSGTPTFTGNVTMSGDLALNGQDLTTASGDLRLGPAGHILPSTGYAKNLGALSTKYLALHAAELWVETLVAQDTLATVGGRVLVGPTTTLTSDLASISTTIVVKHNSLATGDRVYLEANGSVEFLAITSGAAGSGPYAYTVTRNLDGTGANAWPAGTAVFDTSDGFIDMYSLRGMKSGSEAGPTIVGNVRLSTTYNDWAPRWAIGNLEGICDYGSSIFGFFSGDCSATNVTVDAANGLRIRHGTTNKLVANTAGDLELVGSLVVSGSGTFAAGSGSEVTLTTTGLTVESAAGGSILQPNGYKFTGAAAGAVGVYGREQSSTSHLVITNTPATSSWEARTTIDATNQSGLSSFVALDSGLSVPQVTVSTGDSGVPGRIVSQAIGAVHGVTMVDVDADALHIDTWLDGRHMTRADIGGNANNQLVVKGFTGGASGSDYGSTVLVEQSGGVVPGMLALVQADGGFSFVYPDNSGVLRTGQTAGSDIPEADGSPSLTSGTVIGSQTSSMLVKNIRDEWTDTAASLDLVLQTPVFRFTYRDGRFDGEEFTGIVTEFSPWFGMDQNRALNAVNAVGHLVSAMKALARRVELLEHDSQ